MRPLRILVKTRAALHFAAVTFIVQRADTISQGAAAELGGVPPVKSGGLLDLIGQTPCRLQYLPENMGGFPEIQLH